MDFFEQQEVARKRSGRLVALFALAVVAIVVTVYLVVAAILSVARRPNEVMYHALRDGRLPSFWDSVLDGQLLLYVGGTTLGVIALGSLYKMAQLRSGGSVIAEALGGRLLMSSTVDLTERKVLNVVEEMAIASGIPMPAVYLLDSEPGINAFAAGYAPGNAVIGITKGCAESLTREQLQGVIAHEFSHILHGDMRLNIQLMGVLHGILVLGLIGSYALRSSFRGVGGSRRSKDNGAIVAVIAVAIALVILGYVGTFFGNLIKAAVSRQREYLADASAVQYTRNPGSIAGALKAIGRASYGSKFQAPNAAQASHMFFGQGIGAGFLSLLATHPPLDERIRRIDPSWDGGFSAGAGDVDRARPLGEAVAATWAAPPTTAQAVPASHHPSLRSAMSQIGLPEPAHVERAQDLLGDIPPYLRSAAQEPFGARAIVYAVLLDRDDGIRNAQLQALRGTSDEATFAQTVRSSSQTDALSRELHLVLIDLALPALRTLSNSQYLEFRKAVHHLVAADKRLDLFEWMLQRILLQHLAPSFERITPPAARYGQLGPVAPHVATLLSAVAHVGQSGNDAVVAFEHGRQQVSLPLTLCSREQCGLGQIGQALDVLAQLTPPAKKDLLTALAAIVTADRQVTVEEGQIMRAVADSLACPMPPLLEGQRLA